MLPYIALLPLTMTATTGYTLIFGFSTLFYPRNTRYFPALKNCPCHFFIEHLELGCFWPIYF